MPGIASKQKSILGLFNQSSERVSKMSKYIEELEKLDILRAGHYLGNVLSRYQLEKSMDLVAKIYAPVKEEAEKMIGVFIKDPFAEYVTESQHLVGFALSHGLEVRDVTSDDGTVKSHITIKTLSSYAYRPSPTE